jgi:hypothetical protein
MIRKIFTSLILMMHFNVIAQYQIPGGGSVPMPPGCEAQFYLANYCVASNIVPLNLSYFPSESEISAITKNPEGISCVRASYSWQSCSMYLRSVVERRISRECEDYWSDPSLQDTSSPVIRERLTMLSVKCGGAIRD